MTMKRLTLIFAAVLCLAACDEGDSNPGDGNGGATGDNPDLGVGDADMGPDASGDMTPDLTGDADQGAPEVGADADLGGPVGEAPPVDYGDAPDGRIQFDGTFDDLGFPTLFGAGGAHTLDTSAVALAFNVDSGAISVEVDADDLQDPDEEPNFIRFREDEHPNDENRDDFDDGIIGAQPNIRLFEEPVLALEVGALLKDDERAGTYYLNVLFDHNIDGAWNGEVNDTRPDDHLQLISATNLQDEWIVKNLEVELTADEPFQSLTFPLPLLSASFNARRSTENEGPYMRLALTDAPIEGSVWHGEGAFAVGEIEDWAVRGLDNPPGLVCNLEQTGNFKFDFAGRAQMPVPCSFTRPPYAPVGPITYNFFTGELSPGTPGAPLVELQCPTGSSGSVSTPNGTNSVSMGCTAFNRGLVPGDQSLIGVLVETDLEGRTDIDRGMGSQVALELSQHLDVLVFENSVEPPEDEVLDACIGLEGTYTTFFGAMIWRVGFEGECSFLENDGESPGTFLIRGWDGFRGRGEAGVSNLATDGMYERSGFVERAVYNGAEVDPGFWAPDISTSATHTLQIEFDTGLFFDIEIDVTVNDGPNTVTQRVVDARWLGGRD